MARLSRRLWGGTSLKTAAKEAKKDGAYESVHSSNHCKDISYMYHCNVK